MYEHLSISICSKYKEGKSSLRICTEDHTRNGDHLSDCECVRGGSCSRNNIWQVLSSHKIFLLQDVFFADFVIAVIFYNKKTMKISVHLIWVFPHKDIEFEGNYQFCKYVKNKHKMCAKVRKIIQSQDFANSKICSNIFKVLI